MNTKVLILPGWHNSGPAHWQSLWEQQHGYTRVEQHSWDAPLRGDWMAQLEEAVLAHEDTVLVAHSLGCVLVAAWAASHGWPKLETWLLNHTHFGPPIRRWRDTSRWVDWARAKTSPPWP